MTALALPVLIGGVALGAEVGVWLMEKRKAQNAADVAAYSAVVERLRTDTDAARARAEDVVHRSGLPAPDTSVDVSFPTPSRAEVVVTRTLPRYFTKLFLAEGPTVAQRAVAEVEQQAGAPACVIALENDSGETGVEINSRKGEIKLRDCTLEVHSPTDESIEMNENADIEAACIVTAGNINEGNIPDGVSLDCGEPKIEASVGGVPPALAALPRLTRKDRNDIERFKKENKRGGTLRPRHSGHSSGVPMIGFMDTETVLRGNITLESGIYVIDRGTLKIHKNANIDGTAGVAFYVFGDGRLIVHQNAELEVRGLQGNFWRDVVLFGDGRDIGLSIRSGKWTGIMFAEHRDVEITRNTKITGCFLLVVDQFEINGGGEINLDCSDSDFDPGEYSDSGGGSGGAPGAPVIRIVE